MSTVLTSRNQIVSLVLSGLASAVMLSGCDTIQTAPVRGSERIAVMPVPGSRAMDGTEAVLLVSDFQGFESDAENDAENVMCRWRVVNQDSKTSYFINFKPGARENFVQLDPGTYKTGRLGCGINRVWDLDNVFTEGFHVDAGRISYLGKLIFEFKDGELTRVRKAPRGESWEAFSKAYAMVPGGRQASFISAFTEKPLDLTMITNGNLLSAEGDNFDVHVKGIANVGSQLKPLLTHLTTCSNTEAAADPIRFGRLEYIALYKDGRFSEMKERQETNAFSDRLRSCVERGIMAFHPDLKKDVEVSVRY